MNVEEFTDENGRNLFRRSFEQLYERSQARINAGIVRMEQGNFGDTHNLGGGVWERRFLGRGAGARLYYALADAYVVILLVAGDKSSAREQQAEIALEHEYLEEWSTRLR